MSGDFAARYGSRSLKASISSTKRRLNSSFASSAISLIRNDATDFGRATTKTLNIPSSPISTNTSVSSAAPSDRYAPRIASATAHSNSVSRSSPRGAERLGESPQPTTLGARFAVAISHVTP